MYGILRKCVACAGLCLLVGASAQAAPDDESIPRPAPRPLPAPEEADPEAAALLFARPEIAEATHDIAESLAAGELETASRILDTYSARFPTLGALHANQAVIAVLKNKPEEALTELEAAHREGVSMAGLATDPALSILGTMPELEARFQRLINTPPSTVPLQPAPALVTNGHARITSSNTAWNPDTEQLEPYFTFPPAPTAQVLPSRPKTAAYELLREHFRRGRATGNHGDLYDNRDRGHSSLEPLLHPQLTHIVYGEAARAAGVDYGLAGAFHFDHPTLGNSSTAFTKGPYWRSLPRHALTYSDGAGPLRLWRNAYAGQFYIYPAHKDFTDEDGDLFPANTPYILISRGSSGSDKPFLQAVAIILAAFQPETKERLVQEHLLVPTIQMVFRRSLQNVRSRESYFSSAAHPAAFDGFQINLARMVSLANSINPGDIPAEVQIAVEQEELGSEGVDFFGQGLDERFFDTPQAIARIWRSKAGRREMIISAADSRDPNGRDLTFHWRLLQGDPDRVKIEPLGNGLRARITIDWQAPRKISDDLPITSSRLDIGVFAYNGVHDSAPAILSWYFPPQENRHYEIGPDGIPRIIELDYDAPEKSDIYADPLLLPRVNWRDEYRYSPDGRLTGWIRHRTDMQEEFTPDGLRILTRTADGKTDRLERVEYVLRQNPKDRITVEERSATTPAN